MSAWTAVGLALAAALATVVLLAVLTSTGCSSRVVLRTSSPEGELGLFVMPKGTKITLPCGDRYVLGDDGVLNTLERGGVQ